MESTEPASESAQPAMESTEPAMGSTEPADPTDNEAVVEYTPEQIEEMRQSVYLDIINTVLRAMNAGGLEHFRSIDDLITDMKKYLHTKPIQIQEKAIEVFLELIRKDRCFIEEFIDDPEILKSAFTYFASYPLSYRSKLISLTLIMVNESVYNASSIGPTYLLEMAFHFYELDSTSKVNVCRIMYIYAQDRIYAKNYGPMIMSVLTQHCNKPNEILEAIRVLAHLVHYNEHNARLLIQDKFFNEQIKSKLFKDYDDKLQAAILLLFCNLITHNVCAEQIYKQDIASQIFLQLIKMDVNILELAICFMHRMLLSGVLTEVEKDNYINKWIELLIGNDQEVVAQTVLHYLSEYIIDYSSQAQIVIDKGMLVAVNFLFLDKDPEDLVLSPLSSEILNLLEVLRLCLGSTVFSYHFDYSRFSRVADIISAYRAFLFKMIIQCEKVSKIFPLAWISTNDDIQDLALIRTLQLLSSNPEARVEFVEDGYAHELIKLLDIETYEFKEDLLHIIYDCIPESIMKLNLSDMKNLDENQINMVINECAVLHDLKYIAQNLLVVDYYRVDVFEQICSELRRLRKGDD